MVPGPRKDLQVAGRETASLETAATKQSATQWLGLAVRARKVALGSDAAMQAITGGQAKLLLLASDTGSNAAKKFRDKCAFYHIPMVTHYDRTTLGRACGRQTLVAAVVTDPGFATKIAGDVGDNSGGVHV